MPSLDKHLLINLQRFTGHSQVQLGASLGGRGPDLGKAQFLHLRNLAGGWEDSMYLQE